MKIGFFTDSYLPSPDGVATSVETCAKELQKLGHEVSIIAPNQPHHKDRKHIYRLVAVHIAKTPGSWFALEIPQPSLFKIASLEFDIIHGHSGGPVSFLGWQLALLHNIPFIETYHTLWKYYKHYFFYPPLLTTWGIKKIVAAIGNDCDAVIAPSQKAKQDLVVDGVKKPIYILPSGLDLEKFKELRKGYLHEKLSLPSDKKIILTVGRLEKEKSIDFLLRSFTLVHKEYQDTVFVIVGEGFEKEKLQKLAAFYGITDCVYFTGALSYADMPHVYADAKLFIFGSQTETQGMVVVESLASGVPVVAVDDEALSDSILDGQNGYLVKRDKDVFAKKVKMILQDEVLSKKLSHNAKRSSEQFSVYFTTKVLEQIYLKVMFDKNNEERQGWQKQLSRRLSSLAFHKHLSKEYKSLKDLLEKISA